MSKHLFDRDFATLFRKSEDGAVTIFGLYMMIVGIMVLGMALDRTNGWRVRTQLQVASDAAVLAAAANLDDIDYARALALETARRNVSDPAIIAASDIEFGHLDPNTLEFTVGADEDGEYTAAAARAGRTRGRDNGVPTLLMSVIGIASLDVNVGSIAVASSAEGESATCHDALFLSTATVDTGGGNDFDGAVCIHGVRGVRTGGGDFFNEQVRFTAENEQNIVLNSYSPGSLARDDLVGQRSTGPVLLPQLDAMRTSIFDDLWVSRTDDPTLWEQPIAPWGQPYHFFVGEYEIDAATYDGILPSFLFDSAGKARVEMREDYVTFSDSDLEENTIYISSNSFQFSGGVDIERAAFISQQNIGIGGGNGLHFDDVYFIGTSLNMAGSITWGDATNPCDVDYGVYVFGTSSLSLGGWYSGASVSGMIGAAPSFNPGGGMTGTGVYFETDSALSMGGNYDLFGCNEQRSSDVPILDPSLGGDAVVAGALLYR